MGPRSPRAARRRPAWRPDRTVRMMAGLRDPSAGVSLSDEPAGRMDGNPPDSNPCAEGMGVSGRHARGPGGRSRALQPGMAGSAPRPRHGRFAGRSGQVEASGPDEPHPAHDGRQQTADPDRIGRSVAGRRRGALREVHGCTPSGCRGSGQKLDSGRNGAAMAGRLRRAPLILDRPQMIPRAPGRNSSDLHTVRIPPPKVNVTFQRPGRWIRRLPAGRAGRKPGN